MKTIYLLLLTSLLLCSCRSSRSMQKEINPMKSDLFYELTSPAYQGEAKRTVYLDFIDYSNLDYYTTVKKKRWICNSSTPLYLRNQPLQRPVRRRLADTNLS